MTERGLPLVDGASACPFVAFGDDRDERASIPDHRHRCYAEARPAPRALAHQEAYCLSSAFPVCPTFQDWARREAARSRDGAPIAPRATTEMNIAASGAVAGAVASGSAASGDEDGVSGSLARSSDIAGGLAGGPTDRPTPGPAAVTPPGADVGAEPDPAESDEDVADGPRNRRNPRRDWAAPPPWLASREGRTGADAEPPGFLRRRVGEPGQGLVGSPADRLAGGPPPTRRSEPDDNVWSSDSRAAAALGAGSIGGDGATGPAESAPPRDAATGRPPMAASPADADVNPDEDAIAPRRPARRPRAYAQHLGGPDGPDWERPRRFEAYPTIRSRVGMPPVPRVVAMAGAVVVLAIALFFLPAILGLGGGVGTQKPSASPSTATVPSASIAPSEAPAPSALLYTVKKGETLSRIAAAHGVTMEMLLAANPTIKDPNKVGEGQQITIPAPSAAPGQFGASASP